jgi:hypothetical protein
MLYKLVNEPTSDLRDTLRGMASGHMCVRLHACACERVRLLVCVWARGAREGWAIHQWHKGGMRIRLYPGRVCWRDPRVSRCAKRDAFLCGKCENLRFHTFAYRRGTHGGLVIE